MESVANHLDEFIHQLIDHELIYDGNVVSLDYDSEKEELSAVLVRQVRGEQAGVPHL